jgi:hypothetical protein
MTAPAVLFGRRPGEVAAAPHESSRTSWLRRETRVGSYRYPLGAMAVAAGSGVLTSVLGVALALRLWA